MHVRRPRPGTRYERRRFLRNGFLASQRYPLRLRSMLSREAYYIADQRQTQQDRTRRRRPYRLPRTTVTVTMTPTPAPSLRVRPAGLLLNLFRRR
jgi:hypothetical protein